MHYRKPLDGMAIAVLTSTGGRMTRLRNLLLAIVLVGCSASDGPESTIDLTTSRVMSPPNPVLWSFSGPQGADSICKQGWLFDTSDFGEFAGGGVELYREPPAEWRGTARKEWLEAVGCSDVRQDPNLYGSAAVLHTPSVAAGRTMTLLFDARAVGNSGNSTPALLKVMVGQRFNVGRPDFRWVNQGDRMYVTGQPLTYAISLNGYNPQWGDASDILSLQIHFERWSSGRTDASILLDNIRLVEGGLPSATPKRAFAGSRVRFRENGAWQVSTPNATGREFRNFFPISINATRRDAEFVGQRIALDNQLSVPSHLTTVGFHRELGWQYFAESGFTVVKVSNGIWNELPRIHGAGLYAYAGISGGIKSNDPLFGEATIADPNAVQNAIAGASPSAGYHEGLLTFWFDWEDHVYFTDFSGWDAIYQGIVDYQQTTYGGPAVPLIVNRGIKGSAAIASDRADGLSRYVNPHNGDTAATLGAGAASVWKSGDGVDLPWAWSVRMLGLADAGSLFHQPTVHTSSLWDAVASGAKGIHHFGYSVNANGGLCNQSTYAGYWQGTATDPACLKADDQSRYPGLWETFGDFHRAIYGDTTLDGLLSFISAERAPWEPTLDAADQRYGSVMAKSAPRNMLLATNIADAPRTPVLHFAGLLPRRAAELNLGSTQELRAGGFQFLNGSDGTCSAELPVALEAYDQKTLAVDLVSSARISRAFVATPSTRVGSGQQNVEIRLDASGVLAVANTSRGNVTLSIKTDAPLFSGTSLVHPGSAEERRVNIAPNSSLQGVSPCATRLTVQLVNAPSRVALTPATPSSSAGRFRRVAFSR